MMNAILFIDVKKAFDTLDHEILLKRLQWYCFRAKALQLFRNYLSQRTQLIEVNNVKFKENVIRCGAPQCSVFGSLLFLLYINDLPNCNLVSETRMYADYTNLTYAAKEQDELVSRINRDLLELKQWLRANKRSLNVVKTKCMFIGTSQNVASLSREPNVRLDGQLIDRVATYKCPGVELDETLTWNAHIFELIGKAVKVLGALRRLKAHFPQRTLISIYKSLVFPYYCSTVWGNCGKGLVHKLEKIQNRAARIITESEWDVPSQLIPADLNWQSLGVRRSKQMKCFMYKSMSDLVPRYLSEKFTLTNAIHHHNLRNTNLNLFFPRPNKEALKKSFSSYGTLWHHWLSKPPHW